MCHLLRNCRKGYAFAVTSCGHAFHVNCITRWLVCGSRCPLCNEKIILSDYLRTKARCLYEGNQSSCSNSLLVSSQGYMSSRNDNYHRKATENNIETIGTDMDNFKQVVLKSFMQIQSRMYERYRNRQRENENISKQTEV
eukprot:jgi/Galph1/3220/GphlegSOOS_G1943.1